ncbi:MAG: hypothetical protein KatS3mg019_0123 [Fimbriimonadales bacterium]|nr:MAG: hypothetical protein KatS3mg019_0123 [Fimbriimonadales bacterium]
MTLEFGGLVSVIIVGMPQGVLNLTLRRLLMMQRRQKFLGLTALMLAIANLMAMPHTLAALNELRGGGGANVPAMSNNGGCGCKQTPIPMSPEAVKQVLAQSTNPQDSNELEYKPTQRRGRPRTGVEVGAGVEVPINPGSPSKLYPCSLLEEVCVGEYGVQITPQKWCDRRNAPGRRCMDQFPEFTNHEHYLKERERIKYTCRGARRTVIWVSCGEWHIVECCSRPQAEPSCLGGANRVCKE